MKFILISQFESHVFKKKKITNIRKFFHKIKSYQICLIQNIAFKQKKNTHTHAHIHPYDEFFIKKRCFCLWPKCNHHLVITISIRFQCIRTLFLFDDNEVWTNLKIRSVGPNPKIIIIKVC